LLWIDIAPSGVREAVLEMGGYSPFIDRLLPDDRVSDLEVDENGDALISILSEPTYFSVHKPATDFQEIEVELLYQSEGQPLIEVGPRVDIVADAFEVAPLASELIESLDWQVIEEDGMRLFARNHDVTSISRFLDELPARSEIAVLGYELETPYRLSTYLPLGRTQTISMSLRGYHRYVTYLKNESFDLDVMYWDMNRTIGADDALVRVRNEEGEIWFEAPLEDDGNVTENQLPQEETISIHESGWPEGVYQVELVGTSDIFWHTIATSQRYVTFLNQLFIGDDTGYLAEPRATTFYTDAKFIECETYHAEGVQTLTIGSEAIVLNTSHEKVRTDIDESGILAGVTPCGDVKMTGDGLFSFSREAFFNPFPLSIGGMTDLDERGINDVLTTVAEPTEEGEWQKASVTFSTDGIWDENGDAKFVLSTPGIVEQDATVRLHEIRIRFLNEPLNFWGFLAAVRDRLPFGL
jgi:hypothetical protein